MIRPGHLVVGDQALVEALRNFKTLKKGLDCKIIVLISMTNERSFVINSGIIWLVIITPKRLMGINCPVLVKGVRSRTGPIKNPIWIKSE